MTNYEALDIILDLASQNALDEQDAEIYNVQEQYEYRQEAFRVVNELCERLKPENV